MLNIEELTLRSENKMRAILSAHTKEKSWIARFGANHIHPRYLVFIMCVQSDLEKSKLRIDHDLTRQLREVLDELDYPISGRTEVAIDFESQETVDRESGGNWYVHLK